MEFPWAAETHKKALVLAMLCSPSSPGARFGAPWKWMFNFGCIARSHLSTSSPPCLLCSFTRDSHQEVTWKSPRPTPFSPSISPCPVLSSRSHNLGKVHAAAPQQGHPRAVSGEPRGFPPHDFTSPGFVPQFLSACLLPHGLLFYFGAPDCI